MIALECFLVTVLLFVVAAGLTFILNGQEYSESVCTKILLFFVLFDLQWLHMKGK